MVEAEDGSCRPKIPKLESPNRRAFGMNSEFVIPHSAGVRTLPTAVRSDNKPEQTHCLINALVRS